MALRSKHCRPCLSCSYQLQREQLQHLSGWGPAQRQPCNDTQAGPHTADTCAKGWFLGYRRSSTLPLPFFTSTTPAERSAQSRHSAGLLQGPLAPSELDYSVLGQACLPALFRSTHPLLTAAAAAQAGRL